jgi:hypothetical protein
MVERGMCKIQRYICSSRQFSRQACGKWTQKGRLQAPTCVGVVCVHAQAAHHAVRHRGCRQAEGQQGALGMHCAGISMFAVCCIPQQLTCSVL